MLTKGAIGNLVNRYKAVLKKCNLINTFGSLAVASMLVMGGAGVAEAATLDITFDGTNYIATGSGIDGNITSNGENLHTDLSAAGWADQYLGYDAITNKNSYNDDTSNVITITGGTNYNQIIGDKSITGDSSNNTVSIYNATVASKVYTATTTTANTDGCTNNNKLIISNSTIKGTAVSDTYSGITAAMVSAGGHAEGNIIEVSNNSKVQQAIWGASVGTGNAINNKVVINDSEVEGWISAGHSAYGNAHKNILEINGDSTKTGQVHGGRAQGGGSATENSVTINGGTINGLIYGGSAVEKHSASVDASQIEASKNIITITGGSITGPVYAGYTAMGVANENTVTITGGSITGDIHGGYGYSEANNNTVTIDGVEVTGNVYGGKVATGGTATGNVVNLLNGAQVTQTVNIGDEGTLTISGETSAKTLEGSGTIVVDSAGSAIDVTTNSGSFTAKGSAKLNDQTGGDLAQVKNAVSGLNLADENITGMDEGLISGAVSADGTKQANTVMQDTLDIATTAPLAVGRIVMNDVRKRMGDLRDATGEAGAWMRWDGGKLKGDEGLTNNFNTIQIGADMLTGIKNVRAGVAAAFTHGDLDHNNGDGEMETYSFSAYGVWMADNGMFADVIARVGFTNTELNVKGRSVDLDNEVFSLSGEYGWRLPVCSQFYVEPQIELTYTYVTGADSKLDYATYEVDALDSLLGRAGMAFGWKLPNDRGNLYARASVVHEFLGDAKITGSALGNTEVHETDGDDTWLEYGIGANVKLTDNTYIWADVERTEGAEIDEEWRGTVGVRFSF